MYLKSLKIPEMKKVGDTIKLIYFIMMIKVKDGYKIKVSVLVKPAKREKKNKKNGTK